MPATREPFNVASRAGQSGSANACAATDGGLLETCSSAVAPAEVRSPSPMLRRAISRASRLLIAENREEIPAEGPPAARWRLRAIFDSARRMVRQHRIVRIFKAELEEGRQRRSAAAEADAVTEEHWEALRRASDLAGDFVDGLSAVDIRGGACGSNVAESIVLQCQLLLDALDGLSESCFAQLRELEILRAELSGGNVLSSTIPRLRAIIEAVRACLREHVTAGGSHLAGGAGISSGAAGNASISGDSRKKAGCEKRCEKTLRSAANAESAFSDKVPGPDPFDEAGRLRRGEALQVSFSEAGPPKSVSACSNAARHEASSAERALERAPSPRSSVHAPSLRSSVGIAASQASSRTYQATVTVMVADDFAKLTGAGSGTRSPSADAKRRAAQPRSESSVLSAVMDISPSMSTRESGHITSIVSAESGLPGRPATRSTSNETNDVVEPMLKPSLQTFDGQNLKAQQTSPEAVPTREIIRRPRRFGPAPPLQETIPPTPEAHAALRMYPSPLPETSPARCRQAASPLAASPSFTPAPRDRYARSPQEGGQSQAGAETTVRATRGSAQWPAQALAQEPLQASQHVPLQAPQHVPTQEPLPYGPQPANVHRHQTRSVGKAWATPNAKGSSRPRSRRRNRSRAGHQSDDLSGRAQAQESAVPPSIKPNVEMRWRIPSAAKGGA